MATRSLGSLTLDLIAKIGGFQDGMDRAARIADQRAREIQKSLNRLNDTASAVGNAIGGVIASLAVGATFQKFVTETVNAAGEQAQLSAVLKSTGEMAGWTQGQLNEMAETMSKKSPFSPGDLTQAQTRLISYENLVGDAIPKALQAAMDMSARTGMSLTQAAETVGKALNVPSEGMASLSRNGFQFTDAQKKAAAQLEETGHIAEAQAQVFDALNFSYGGAAEAARDTLGGALQALQHNLEDLFTGSDDQAAELKGAIEGVNEALSDPSVVSAMDALKQVMVEVAVGASDLFKTFAGMGGFQTIGDLAKYAGDQIKVSFAQAKAVMEIAGMVLGGFGAEMAALAHGDFSGMRVIWQEVTGDIRRARDELQKFERQTAYAASMTTVGPAVDARAGRGTNMNNGTVQANQIVRPPAAIVRLPKGGGGSKNTYDAAKAQMDAMVKALEQNASQEQSIMASRQKFLDYYNSQGLLSISSYYESRRTITDAGVSAQMEAYDKEIAALQKYQAQAKKQSDRDSAQQKINDLLAKKDDLQRKTAEDAVMLSMEEQKANDDLRKQYDDINAALLEMQGNLGKAAGIRFDAQYDSIRKLAEANGNADVLGQIDQLKSLTVARADYNAETTKSSNLTAQLQIFEDRLSLSQQLGATNELAGLQQLGQARQDAAAQMEPIVEAQEAIAKASGDPAMILQAQQARLAYEQLAASMNPLADKFNTIFSDEAGSALSDFINGTKSAGEAFKSFADGVLEQINDLVSKSLMKDLFGGDGAIAKLLGNADSSSGGGIGAFFANWLGGARAAGGPVSSGSMYRINENGPEILRSGNRQYLLTGDTSGTVVPNGRVNSGGVAQTNNFIIQGQIDRRTQNQIATEQGRASRRAARLAA